MALNDDDDDDGPKQSSIMGKRLILILIAVLVVIIGAFIGVAYMLGWVDDLLGTAPKTLEEVALERGETGQSDVGYFFPLEEITVGIQSSGNRSRFLKLKLVLELESQTDVAFVEQVLPRILDNFQIFLREIRVNELQGSQGIYRVREELLRRINSALNPIKIRDVLFQDIMIQ